MEEQTKDTVGEYYSCSDAERLTNTDIDDAVEEYLDCLDDLPSTVEVHRYVRNEITNADREACVEEALENIYEYLDENYGDPEEATERAASAKDLAKAFVDGIIKTYDVWTCEAVNPPIVVNVAKWIRENNPEWLEDAKVLEQVEQMEREEEDDIRE
jgi:hypothetical protein